MAHYSDRIAETPPNTRDASDASNMNEIIHRFMNRFGRRSLAVGLTVLVLSVGVAAPLWFTRGFVSNARLSYNVGLFRANTGIGLGSRTLFVRQGQNIDVDVEVHDIKVGQMYATLAADAIPSFNSDAAYILHRYKTPGKYHFSLTAKETGLYHLTFSGKPGENTQGRFGGKFDLTYSAHWKVK